MRQAITAALLATALAGVSHAADRPVIGPPPAWVKPAGEVVVSTKTSEAAVRFLLSDQQVALERGRQTVYSESVLKIQTPQGLAAGNISFAWRPDTDVPTVHKLRIRRGDATIDVLASGQTFTVVRRETNLDSATLDGVLTANIQPEGLQVGDILEFTYSVTSNDPVLKGHVEHFAGAWNGLPVEHAHLRMQWPSGIQARLRQVALPPLKPVTVGATTSVELALDNLEPIVPPKGAPVRFQLGRLVEVTDFTSWADLGALMAPLYDAAAVLPATGPLRAEFDRIQAISPDPKLRAQAALTLVQDRVRYVALAMGAGGLVPASAETSWARRFGDCKGKTALLLALLHALGVQAEPVAVNSRFGDGLDARLPMVDMFDHVLVRATIAGRSYWLDGTRTGDTDLDRLVVPSFGWGLPLVARNAALIRILPPPLVQPTSVVTIQIDARSGLTVPAPTKVTTVLRGDVAMGTNLALANLAGDARDRGLRDYWRGEYDFIDPTSVSATFDPKTGEQRLSMEGLARMDWSKGQYETDGTSLGYKADFSRDPGADRDAPFAVAYPYSTKVVETVLLPPGFVRADGVTKADVDQTVAGIEYHRHVTLAGDAITIEKTERSVAPEFPAKDAPAAQIALRALADETVWIRKPARYMPTEAEVSALLAVEPTNAAGFLRRGGLLLDRKRYADAIKDYDRAVVLEPGNASAIAGRGMGRILNKDYDAASKDLDAAQAINPKDVVLLRARGLMAQERGTPQEAVRAYTASLEVSPQDLFALYRRAESNKAAGNDDAALADAAAIIRLDPRQIDIWLLRANIYRNQGKRSEALAEAAAMATANPTIGYAHVAAANLYCAYKMEADAIREFDRALAIKPEAFVYINRGLCRAKTDLAGRRADFETAIKLDVTFGEAHAVLARLQADAGDFAGAIATYTKAITLVPDDAGMLIGRGVVFFRAGDSVHGTQDFAVARARSSSAETLNNFCWSKATANVALDSALADCDAALAVAPENAAIRDSRAFVLLRLGRFDESIADFTRALAKNPNMSNSLFGRAVAWARKGDRARSDADAATALKNDADVQTNYAQYGITR